MTILQILLLGICILGAIVLLLLIATLVGYNKLVTRRNRLRETWSGIGVQLNRRHELVPNLVSVVKGHRDHESDLFEEVARLRRTAARATASARTATAPEEALSTAIGSLFALAEDDPDLRSDASFRQLHGNLVAIEDDLQYARRGYNESVHDLNTMVEGFPSRMVARATGFRSGDFFEVASAADRIPPCLRSDLAGS